MAEMQMPLADLLKHLEKMAEQALVLWDIPQEATVQLINVSENVTFLVQASDGYKSVLRIHRQDYHTRRAIECELAWLKAVRVDGIASTPQYFTGHNGEVIQSVSVPELGSHRFMVLFQFLEGNAPDEAGDLTTGFEVLGAIAARCHDHVSNWAKPQPFERLTWDAEAVFGGTPTWGNWRDAPGVDAKVRTVLERVEATVRARLAAFGKAPQRYNLIHADMRLANLLVDDTGTRLIDFDDCGHGWFMYDFAAAISFIEDDPRIPHLKAAWLQGYRSVRELSVEDEAEIDTMIMLRRMALLAWIGSHIQAPEPQALAPGFAATTARLGAAFLERLESIQGQKT